ncbi:33984_t:CDS:2, partial [Racocetra persica]
VSPYLYGQLDTEILEISNQSKLVLLYSLAIQVVTGSLDLHKNHESKLSELRCSNRNKGYHDCERFEEL